MAAVCKKCGKEIDGKSPICMYCGTVIDDVDIAVETKERMEKESSKPVPNDGSSAKAFGAFLVILGILADVVSMFLIFSADFAGFSVITIAGTIAFLIGIAVISNS